MGLYRHGGGFIAHVQLSRLEPAGIGSGCLASFCRAFS